MVKTIAEDITASMNENGDVQLTATRPDGLHYDWALSPRSARLLAIELEDAADAGEAAYGTDHFLDDEDE